MLVLKGLVGLHRTVQLQLLQRFGWGIDLDYCDIEWFALETNRDHSVVFEIASNYCISDAKIRTLSGSNPLRRKATRFNLRFLLQNTMQHY